MVSAEDIKINWTLIIYSKSSHYNDKGTMKKKLIRSILEAR